MKSIVVNTAIAEERTNLDTAMTDLPRLLYLTTEYPHISHTFIRREILGLESLGYEIHRVALHKGESEIDDDDVREEEKTLYLLAQTKSTLAWQVVRGIYLAGTRVLAGLVNTLKLSRASDRSLVRHIAYLLEAFALMTVADQRQVDHVHVHFGTNAATVAYLSRLMGGPGFSVTVHGPVEFDQPYGQSLGEKLAAASFVVAITSFCKSQLYRWLPAEHWQHVHIVPCTVGDEWFNASRVIDESSSGLVAVGRLDEQKGQLLMIDAFAAAVQAGFKGNLVMVGDGPFRAAIESRITASELQDRIELHGWQSAARIRTLLLEAKGLVLASFAEGLPVVIMEAMALQRPVLSSRITGIPELVRHGTDGFLFTPADTVQMTDAMLALDQACISELARMGKEAQQQVRARHHTDDAVRRLDELFRNYCD